MNHLGSCLLLFSTGLAFFCSNASWSHHYHWILEQPFTNTPLMPHLNFQTLINEGAMVFFFLYIGLELQQEFLRLKVNSWRHIVLPISGALGGMLVPSLVYSLMNYQNFKFIRGWAIPTATDIPFVLAVLAGFGATIPKSLKLFITALAIFDDLGAVLIIAAFYTKTLYWFWTGIALSIVIGLMLLKNVRVPYVSLYLLLGGLLWVSLLKSGIHTSISGALLGILFPNGENNFVSRLHKALKPWIEYMILPVFVWVNAGLPLSIIQSDHLTHSVFLGVLLGLWLGKPLGILLGLKIGLYISSVPLPREWTRLSLLGVSTLAGIGFTMSLFITTLAFQDSETIMMIARHGIFIASLCSAGTATAILKFNNR